MTARRRWTAAAAAVALVVPVVVSVLSGGEAVAHADDFGGGDGLHRYVVVLEGSPAAAAADASTGPTAAPGAPSGPTATAPTAPASPDAEATDAALTPRSTASAAAASSARSGPAAPDAPATGTWSTARARVDLSLLARAQAQLGLDGHTEDHGTVAYYVTDGGAMVITEGGGGEVTALADTLAVPAPAPVTPPRSGASLAATRVEVVLPAAPATTPPATTPPATPHAPEVSTLPVDPAAVSALAAQPGVVSAQPLDGGRVLVATRLDLDDVTGLPGVAAAEVSPQARVLAAPPSDPLWARYGYNIENTGSNAYQQTAVAGADVNAPTAWETTQGQGAVIAVVDTGFDTDHPDLAGALWTNPTEACGSADTNGNGLPGDCHGWNFYVGSSDLDNGTLGSHGTSVSGAAAARAGNGSGSAGVAPKAQIMPLVVGGGTSIDVLLAAKAIRYAADNGADVVNGSFGGGFGGYALDQLRGAIDYAVARGVVVVVAAGNDSADRDAAPLYPASFTNPGMITVGSSTASDTIAGHSAYGAASVDVFAPGSKVVAPWPGGGYVVLDGTSIASPHVAAAAALYRSLRPDMPVQDVVDRILSDAERRPAFAGRSVTGARLDLADVGAVVGEDAATYAFAGMTGTPGAQTPRVTVTSPAEAGSYQLVLGLAMLVDGEIWAVADEDVTVDGRALTTDDTGQVTLDLGTRSFLGALDVRPALTLGAGSFGLTAQVLKDGQPLTRPYAAPLVVRPAPVPPAPAPTSSATPAPGTSPAPGGSGPAPGATPRPTTPGSTPAPSTSPDRGSTPTPTAPRPTSSATPRPGTSPVPGTTPTPGATPGPAASPPPGTTPRPTPRPSTSPSAAATPRPSATTPPAPVPAPSTSPTSGTVRPTPAPTATSPGPDVRRYDQVGAFRVTSISPVHVGTAGGTVVTVTGTALEAGVGVRVGGTRTADVLSSSSTSVVFRTPSAVAGTYDVTLFKNGRTSVLTAGLVYQGGSAVPAPGGAPPSPVTTPSPATSAPAPTPVPTPVGGAPGPGATTPAPGGGPGTTPTTPSATRVGPNGERLVRNDALAALAGLWATECARGCRGVQA